MKELISVEISDNYINILCGKEKHIKNLGTINLEPGLVVEGIIRDEAMITRLLKTYFKNNKIHCNDISFTISGGELIIRNIEIPLIKKEALKKAIEFEFRQILRDIDEYYTDYTIVGQNVKDSKGSYDILLVASAKERVDSIMSIAASLGKKVHVIDVLSNSLNRALISNKQIYPKGNVGILYLNKDVSYVVIAENEKFKMDRTLPFGIENIVKDMAREEITTTTEEEKINEISKNLMKVFDQYPRVKNNFDNVLSIVNKTIQFYSTGKVKKGLDKLIVVTAIEVDSSVVEYIGRYLNVEIASVNRLNKRNSSKEYIGSYVACYGLLKMIDSDINLNPKKVKKGTREFVDRNSVKIIFMMVLFLNVLVWTSIRVYDAYLKDQIETRSNYFQENSQNAKIVKLLNEKDEMSTNIDQVSDLERNRGVVSEDIKYLYANLLEDIKIKELRFNKGSMEINAVAADKGIIADLLVRLKAIELYKEVDVKSISLNSFDTYDFVMNIKGGSK